MSAWQYLAYSIDGNGNEELLYNDLPLTEVEIHQTLDGAGSMSASISPEIPFLQQKNGRFTLDSWGTVIVAVKDSRVWFCGLLSMVSEDGPKISFTAVNFNQYLKNIPYLGKYSVYFTRVDEVIKEIWKHVQSQPNGDLNLSVVPDITAETVGTKSEKPGKKPMTVARHATLGSKSTIVKETQEVDTTETEQDEPFEMNSWSTSDLEQVVSQLCDTADLNVIEEHTLRNGKLTHKLLYKRDIYYGRTLKDGRFVVGENIFTVLPIDYQGENLVDELWIQGAGDGSAAIRERAYRAPGDRLRRVGTISDQSINSKKVAKAQASKHLKSRQIDADFSGEIAVHNTDSAELGTYGLGDTIYVQSEGGWANALNCWVYIKEWKLDPETEIMTLTVERIEKRGLDTNG